MNGRKVMTLVSAVILVVLVVGPALAVPTLADSPNMVKGVVTGVGLWQEMDGGVVQSEFQYRWDIIQVGEGCAAKGWATFDGRTPGKDPVEIKVAIDCVEFATLPDGRRSATYSGEIVKSNLPDWYKQYVCDWQGQLKVGMVIDDGDALSGDEIHFWWPIQPYGCFYPNLGVPLNCSVPDNSVEIQFELTSGDIEVRFD